MIGWLKNLFFGEEKIDKAKTSQVLGDNESKASDANTIVNANTSMAFSDNAAVQLEFSSRIQSMVEEKGPQAVLQVLLQELFDGLNNPQAVEYFSAYYQGQCSKKDILDKYDTLVKVEQDTLEGIACIGKYYDKSLVGELFGAEDTFCIYDKEFFTGIVEELISGHATSKQVQSKLWSKYFNFVKVFLDIGKKVGLTASNQANSEGNAPYEPVDEIEATLIKLLEAEQKA